MHSPPLHAQSSSFVQTSSPVSYPNTTSASLSPSYLAITDTFQYVTSSTAHDHILNADETCTKHIHTALWGGLAGLALFRFRSRVRFPTTVVGVSAVSGYGFGLFHYFREHRKFAQQLDDRQAFLLVLENVNKRLGNHGSLFPQLEEQKMFDTIMKRKQEHGEVLSPDVEFVPDSDSTTEGVAPSPPARSVPPKSKPVLLSQISL